MATVVQWGVGCIAIWLFLRSLYRLYFHPLSKFPGPKLAAITSGYEFYYNVIKRGMFIWEVEKLHQKYGPIIRINPREIHIKDPDYYDEIYASSTRKREKDPIMVAQFGLEGSAFASISPETHRQRRAPLDKFFSKQSITRMEHIIHQCLGKLSQHLQDACKSHKVVSLDAGFAGLASDVIHRYAWGFNSGNLDADDFNEHVRDGISGLFRMAHVMFFFPVLQMITNSLPLWLLERLNPFAFAMASQKRDLHKRAVAALRDSGSKADKSSIIDTLAGPSMPRHMRTPDRLMNEGFSLVIGGTETTARSLSLGFYHLLTNEPVRRKLREELRQVMPTPDSQPTWSQLEQLPYLSGVILEFLRLSTGISSRSPRIAPAEALVYKGYVIPPGTLVSETNYFILMDPNIFPDPHAFDPERWMRAAAKGERLDRYLVNFSKGSRICLGMNLAYAELFLVTAMIIRRFDLELYRTSKEDIDFVRDFGTPYPDNGNFSIRATVTNVIDH
ncbi:cytochrome P450 [Aspergillus ambiguus]|uniref:cytochrome P450 n=1 Tax=Aspergillus ambiguus TaxID=176160 RepID=UPI003CCD23C3